MLSGFRSSLLRQDCRRGWVRFGSIWGAGALHLGEGVVVFLAGRVAHRPLFRCAVGCSWPANGPSVSHRGRLARTPAHLELGGG